MQGLIPAFRHPEETAGAASQLLVGDLRRPVLLEPEAPHRAPSEDTKKRSRVTLRRLQEQHLAGDLWRPVLEPEVPHRVPSEDTYIKKGVE